MLLSGQAWFSGLQELSKALIASAEKMIEKVAADTAKAAQARSINQLIDLQIASAESTCELAGRDLMKLTQLSIHTVEASLRPFSLERADAQPVAAASDLPIEAVGDIAPA